MLLGGRESQEERKTQTRGVDLEGGKWEHEEGVSECLVTRHVYGLPSQSAIMAAPNFEEAAAIATEFISSASRAQSWFLSG